MARRRVVLFDHRRLLGESIQRLLLRLENVELLGPWSIDQHALARLKACRPDVVIIVADAIGADAIGADAVDVDNTGAETGLDRAAATPTPTTSAQDNRLASAILESFDDLPVIRVDLDEAMVRVYRVHALPAQRQELIQAILQEAPLPDGQTIPWMGPPFPDGGE